ncbi:MAG TPA: VOC family protein [Geobacteraceae bacterium]|nr:VOC family protein [Geobacteraceae bacterium]
MIKRFDHATIVVRDMEEAIRFFGLLGFRVDLDVNISGEILERYMGIKELEARHVTLVLADSPVRQEVQLVKYNHPEPIPDPHVGDLNKLGYNHVCFVVNDIEAEVERLKAAGVEFRNEIMDFHSRKLIYFYGPEGVTLELAQWH